MSGLSRSLSLSLFFFLEEEGGIGAFSRAFLFIYFDPDIMSSLSQSQLLKAWHSQREEIKLLKAQLATAEIKLRTMSQAQ